MQPPKRKAVRGLLWACVFLYVLAVTATGEPNPNGNPEQNGRRPLHRTRSIAEACPTRYVSHDPRILACPTSQGITLLSAHYPPRTLFIGYDSASRYLDFLKALIEQNANRISPLQVVVLIPRLDVEQAYEDLKPFMRRAESHYLTLFTTSSDETLWTQDYLEVGISMEDGEAKIIDLPYPDREGEWIPATLALSCQLELIPQAGDHDREAPPYRGDYGGNIEALPGNVLLVGNTMSSTTRNRLQGILTGMATLAINVHWLDTGHVDEVFTVLPNRAPKAACPFALAYTSPRLALRIIRQHGLQPDQDRLVPQPAYLQDARAELKDWAFFSDCLAAYAQSKSLSRRCQRLIEANTYYDRIIEQDRRRIHDILIKHNACAPITWIALPQLFVPSFEVWLQAPAWGTEADRAQAINPNTVNVIALGEDLIIPRQPYLPFEQEVERRLTPLGLLLLRVDSAYSHFLNGGLHCNTSVARMCRPKGLKLLHGPGSGLR